MVIMKQKIPKKIHYCWFGGNPLPDDAKKYIDSWKKFCPDYEIIEWNESNFDLNSNDYIKEAYDAKKWAFVTDYVGLYVMYNFGGVYMDTDVELLSNIDKFLEHDAFSGFESVNWIPTGIMACKKGFTLFKELLDDYDDRHFIKEDGTYDLTTNVLSITKICKKYGLELNNNYQVIEGFALYPNDVFCPKSHETGIINITNNTVAIHHFAGSWLDNREHSRRKLRYDLIEKYGDFWGGKILYALFMPYRICSVILQRGFKDTVKEVLKYK